jgi:hypothetical protein
MSVESRCSKFPYIRTYVAYPGSGNIRFRDVKKIGNSEAWPWGTYYVCFFFLLGRGGKAKKGCIRHLGAAGRESAKGNYVQGRLRTDGGRHRPKATVRSMVRNRF